MSLSHTWSFSTVFDFFLGFSEFLPVLILIKKSGTFLCGELWFANLRGLFGPEGNGMCQFDSSNVLMCQNLAIVKGKIKDVPYTAYFDKARQGRTGTKMINPNDPEENPDLSIDSEDLSGKGSVRSTQALHKSSGDPKNFIDSPARHYNAGNKSGGHGGHGVGSADNRRRPSRQSTGSEYSVERSPLHCQAKTPGRDSPSWEGHNSYDNSHGTPGRSRLKLVNRGDETPDKGAAVPKFGEWDVSNPASADGFTHIFNKVREERQGGAGHTPGTPNERPHAIQKQPTDDKAQCFCFAWGKK